MNKESKRGWILGVVGVFLLIGSGTRHQLLVEMRRDRDLQQVSPGDTTPLVAITTVAFGGFRGLVADALWVRANKLQDEGQYFELVQISKWITQLEPRVPEVWSFQAWNLAYNISVLFPEYSDRWRWVSHGMDLLRKQGLTHNPNSPDLYWDIGWMFQHKIGISLDSDHHLYKRELKEQVEAILPRGRLTPELLTPEKKQSLLDTFHMSADRMISLEKEYGPLDWRIPNTHVLYWGTSGLDHTDEGQNYRRLRRMQMYALGSLMRGGTLRSSEDGRVRVKLPRMELIDPVIAHFENLLATGSSNEFLEKGYDNFLYDAILLHAEYGNLSEAYSYYQKWTARSDDIPGGRQNFQSFIQFQLTRNPAELEYEQVMIRIVALLHQSLQTQDPIRRRGYQQMAEQVHHLYQEARQTKDHLERTGLSPFEDIVSLVKESVDTQQNL